MTPPAWLWKRKEQRLSRCYSGPCSTMLVRRSTRRLNSRRKDLDRRFYSPSGWTLRCLSVALVLFLQALEHFQPVAASSSGAMPALPTDSNVAQDQVVAKEKSSSDTKIVPQEEAKPRILQLQQAESTSDARESSNHTLATPITAENFFLFHRWGNNGNVSRAGNGTSEHDVDSSRNTKGKTASKQLQRSREEGRDPAEVTPPSRFPRPAALVGKAAIATETTAVTSTPKTTAAATETAAPSTETAATKEAAAAATETAAAETENKSATEKGAAAAAATKSSADAATQKPSAAEAATEAERMRATKSAAAAEKSGGAKKARAAKTAGAAKTRPPPESTSAAKTVTKGMTQGTHELAVSSRGGLRPRKKGGLKPSLQDVAALAGAAAAAVAALNRGGLEFSDPVGDLNDTDSLLEFHGAFRRAQDDTVEQPAFETVQKLAQMVQEARENELGMFDPVDSKGKKTIILKEWYTTTVASTMVGRRETDEDALLVGAPSAVKEDVRFKAVFDGHGGEKTSEYCADNVARYLGGRYHVAATGAVAYFATGVLENFSFKAVKDACLRMDADVLKAFGPRNVAGSTGVIAIIEKVHTPLKVTAFGREIIPEDPVEAAAFIPVEVQLQQEELAEDPLSASRYTLPSEHSVTLGPEAFLLTLVNIGDSRAMLFHEDGSFTRLSKDHKPNNPVERARVEKAGGFVSNAANDVPRVDGILALSRAFGDSDFKAEANLPPDQQRVVAVPDVRHFYVLPSDMLIMACDGVFEPFGMDWKYLHDVAVEELRASNDLEKMVSRMMDYAFTMNSHDNISVVATAFHRTKVTEPAVVYKSIGGTGEVIEEAKLPEGSDAFSYAALNEGIFSLH